MTIRLYNTKSQKVEEFIPRKIGEASLYLCGLTTYDHAHVGHARTNIVFDILARHLRVRNLKVTYVRNVTDVDDKILKRASEQNRNVLEFSNEMATICKEELLSVGCENPDHEPHVSKHMKEIIQFVEKLIEMKFAYVVEKAEGKDVYFHVRSFSDYGKLSKRNIDDLISGARIDASEIKQDPLDFALWKGSTEAWGWESPWGKGRPGWHIECSAMSHAILGEHFDIHGGGMDLIFPHHENEIAQSEAIFGPEMANFWMHSGFLVVDKEKMSKSLGNFVTIQQVLEKNDQEALRYFLLNSHYRSPLNFEINVENEKVSFPSINEAERKIDYFYSTLELAKTISDNEIVISNYSDSVFEKFLMCLDDDLDTRSAVSIICATAKSINDLASKKSKDKERISFLAEEMKKCCKHVGLLNSDFGVYTKRTQAKRMKIRNLDSSFIEEEISKRAKARLEKNFLLADFIRGELLQVGVKLQDEETQTTWQVVI